MREVDGEKLSQSELDIRLVQACHNGDLKKVVKYVGLGANVNATDALGYGRALSYAIDNCSRDDDEADLIVKHMVECGAEINFKHGDKGSLMASRPYFIYYAVTNYNCSDDLVEYLIRKGGTANLDYVPTKGEHQFKSALDELIRLRPNLYNKLVKKGIVSNKKSR